MNCLICLSEIKKSKFKEYHDACFRGLFGTIKIEPQLPFSRKEFFEERARKDSSRVSISGVQPKLAVKIEDKKLETTNKNFTHIIKPSPEDYPQAAENEHLTMQISQLLKINTAGCGLIRFSDNELVYITKRFDFTPGQEKIHQEDMMQGMGIHPELYTNAKYEAKSYEDVGLFLSKISSPLIAKDLFERVFFNYMVSNNDYHLKNISIQFKMGLPGNIRMSPHYDTLNTGIYGLLDGELACSLVSDGGGFPPAFAKWGYYTRQSFNYFGKNIGLTDKVMEKIYSNFMESTPEILELVDRSFLNAERKEKYKRQLEDRRVKFGRD